MLAEAAIGGARRTLRQLKQCTDLWRSSIGENSRLFCSGTAPGPPPPPPPPPPTPTPPRTDEAETEVKPDRSKLMVLGGNGFVGSYVCKEAVVRGISVASLNRSGRPPIDEPWVKKVEWVRGNLFDADPFGDNLHDVSSVISCVGGFGSNETMRKINGDANVKAVNAAAEAGVKRFVYVSAADFGLASYFLRGYYEGKRAAENAVRSKFPYGGVILRPGFIYGNRRVGGVQIPLGVIGTPLEMVFRNLKSVSTVPVIGQLVVPPVKASAVAKAAIRSALDNAVPPGVLDVWGIIRVGDHF